MKQIKFKGACTALITPFTEKNAVDTKGLKKLINFQIENKNDCILSTGTTGESPVLDWKEHNKITELTGSEIKKRCLFMAGAGSNNTKEALHASQNAIKNGADILLLVDPYYNGPSSLEIRREYLEPVAKSFPKTALISYVIPGRTGTKLLSEDLAIMYSKYKNLIGVKEASGSLDDMKKTRKLCGKDFAIISGDDPLTFKMMTDKEILASGVISVASNIAPKAVAEMTSAILNKEIKKAEKLNNVLMPLFNIVTVVSSETTQFGKVNCKARNPLAIKTLMKILGMPAGLCRPPLGKMTKNGLDIVIKSAKEVYEKNPEILKPIEEFFSVSIKERLSKPKYWEDLQYKNY